MQAKTEPCQNKTKTYYNTFENIDYLDERVKSENYW